MQKGNKIRELYYNMEGFSFGIIALGIELAIVFYILSLVMFHFINNLSNPYEVLNLGNFLASIAGKTLFIAVIIGLIGDLVSKGQQKSKE